MAALDRRLRRGERTLSGIETVFSAISRLATVLPDAVRQATRPRAKPEPSAARPDPGTV